MSILLSIVAVAVVLMVYLFCAAARIFVSEPEQDHATIVGAKRFIRRDRA